ncbi:hypothetical protein PR048_012794 [Dryococelus australis]|uniref:Reverse transcriptase domain-containing protein n=1 Tax=Dryococelus australis TaxID=614101 RepID=A0ABQ9HQS5_9NEOP|nr:hypothetical protein PR048_012794 [Dryococelus australis]
MVNQVRSYSETYMLEVSLGISGAFDNAWWPYILWQLRLLECLKKIYWTFKNFLTGRICVWEWHDHREEEVLSKGCPQGSVLGPLLWNVIFEGLLRLYLLQGYVIYGYTDVGLLFVSEWSRRKL